MKVQNHCFINTIEVAKNLLSISDDIYNAWILDVAGGLKEKNYWALERKGTREYAGTYTPYQY
eukprot:6129514-Ditylum_brightwellii.AAC.1